MQQKTFLSTNHIEPTRSESLLLWMLRNKKTYKGLGQALDMSGVNVSKLLGSERISPARHAQFLALGLPAELLPAPSTIRQGRIPDRDKFVLP